MKQPDKLSPCYNALNRKCVARCGHGIDERGLRHMNGMEMMLKQVGFDPEAIKKVLMEAKQNIDAKLQEIDAKLARIESKLDAMQNGSLDDRAAMVADAVVRSNKNGRDNSTGAGD